MDDTISLKIKSTSQTFDISVALNASVSDVKEVIVGRLENVAKEQLCLIFSGKILKDHETLDACKITNGMAIHLVVRQTGARPAPAATAATTSTPAPATTPQPQPTPETGAAPNLNNMFGRMGGGSPAAIAQMMQSNPDMMRQMMDSPIVQSLMSNPDVMRSMMASNPQIQELIQRNPEIGHILNDPDIMRQTMEMMRNPHAFNEMMRNHDLAIRNLQGIPGGEAALQRLYQDVQEPLLNSASSTFGGNPYASSGNNDENSSRSQRAGVENRDALPNPWGASPNARQSSGNSGSDSFGGRSPFDMLGGGAGGMDDMMRQMMNDPAVMASLTSPEMLSLMSQQMNQHPELFGQVFQSNPMLQGNPQLAEQLRSQLPQMMSMFSRPEVQTAMTNPRVLEAIRQIQQGSETLRREAPELARMFGMPTLPGTHAPPPTTATPQPSAGAAPTPAGNQDMAQMMRMMQTAFGNMNTGGAADQNTNFEELYSAQLEQLASMGFTNRAQNITALRASFGDLNGAVERLLNSP